MELSEPDILLSGAVTYDELAVKEIKRILKATATDTKWEFYTKDNILLAEGTV